MVADRHRDERGQLLLVGGISIALVIVGGVVLLNGMLFTNTVGSHGNQDAMSEAERTIETMENGLRRLTDRVRADTSLGEFRGAIERNLTVYTRQYTNLSFDNGIVYTDAELNETASKNGTLLRQNLTASGTARTFTDGDDVDGITDEDTLYAARNATSVTSFNLTIHEFPCNNGPNSKNTNVSVEENGTNAYWRLNFTSSTPCAAGSGTRYITVYNSSEGEIGRISSDSGEISGSGPVELEVSRTGELLVDGGARFEFASGVSPAYDLWINNSGPGGGIQGKGTYRILTDSQYPPKPASGSSHPNVTKPIAEIAVDITYQRPELRYERTVRLYEEG